MSSELTVDEIITKEIAAKAVKVATQEFMRAEEAYKDADFKCNKLRKFRQDYVDRFNNEMKATISADTQQGFRSFFLRLDVVIMEQQELVEERNNQLKVKRRQLSQARANAEQLETVTDLEQLAFA